MGSCTARLKAHVADAWCQSWSRTCNHNPTPRAACSSYVRPRSTGAPFGRWHRYLEVKTVAVQLLSRYTFTMAKGNETRTYGPSLTLVVKDGMLMDITPVLAD